MERDDIRQHAVDNGHRLGQFQRVRMGLGPLAACQHTGCSMIVVQAPASRTGTFVIYGGVSHDLWALLTIQCKGQAK